MRGKDEQKLDVFSYVSPEHRVPKDYPFAWAVGSGLWALGKETPGCDLKQIVGSTISAGPPYSGHQSDRAIQSNYYPALRQQAMLAGLQRDVHGDADSRVLAVVEVISIVYVIDVDLVSPVPGRRPGFRPRIDQAEPEA
jgi:hypothetical protein